MRTILLAAACFSSVLFAAGEVPLNPEKGVVPGIERGAWSLEAWGNSGAAEKIVVNDRKMLKLIYSSEGRDKAAFKHLTFLGIDREGKVRLHIHSAEEDPPQVGLAISTTRAYRWHESKPCKLKKGWNKLEFSVGSKDWKTQTSQWKYSVPVEPIDDVRAIDIVIYNEKRTGVMLVEGLTYDPDETGRRVNELIKDLRSEDLELRAKAEKELVAIGRAATEGLYQVADDERPEVLLRAASALRQIEEFPEEMPSDPQVRTELEKQREEQRFDEARRRADYTMFGLDSERAKLFNLAREAAAELSVARTGLDAMKHVDVEKRKAYAETLNKIETAIKELQPLVDAKLAADKKAAEEKAAADKKAADEKKAMEKMEMEKAQAEKAK